MKEHPYWLIHLRDEYGDSYYLGYYVNCLPAFGMAIGEAAHLASFFNAKMIYDEINKTCPCNILIVEGHDVRTVYPE